MTCRPHGTSRAHDCAYPAGGVALLTGPDGVGSEPGALDGAGEGAGEGVGLAVALAAPAGVREGSGAGAPPGPHAAQIIIPTAMNPTA